MSSKQSNFFSVRTETNRNSICFGCFSVCFAKPKNSFFGLFRFVLVFRIGIETTETNRTLSEQTKTNQKISKKRSLWGSRNSKFFSRFEPKQTETQSVLVVIRFFCENQKFFFRFVSVFRTGIGTTETNRTYGMGN